MMEGDKVMEPGVFQQQLGDVRDDLSKLRADLGEIVRTIIEAGKTEAGEAREKLEAKVRQQLDAFNSAAYGTRQRGRMVVDRMNTQIEEHPMGSVLGALGVGFLLGMFMRR